MAETRSSHVDGAKQEKRKLKLKELNVATLKRLANLHSSKARRSSTFDSASHSGSLGAEPIIEVPEHGESYAVGDRQPVYRRCNTFPGCGSDSGATIDAATQTWNVEDEPSQLMHCSKEGLIEMLAHMKSQLEQKDNEVCDLHDYVDRLLIRIMKMDASLLQHPSHVERLGSHAA